MERAPWCVESQRQAEPLHIPQYVAAVERRFRRCCESNEYGLRLTALEQRIFAAVQPGEEIKYQPGFGNRNLFCEWKNRGAVQGKVTRSYGKYYRAFPEKGTVN